MEETYDSLASCYDAMTQDIDYPRWADYIEEIFRQEGHPVRIVLDLACGTGTMSCLLSERGYEPIGVDFSPEMLAVAAEKGCHVSGIPPIFLCQSMQELDLYGTIEACVCLLDSVNHVTEPEELRLAFERVYLFTEPGGVFLFDIHTPEHLRSLDGGIFLDETDDAYCVWRTDYSPEDRICTYAMDIFRAHGDLWERDGEIHEEYAYTVPELTEMLEKAGFDRIRVYGNLSLHPPKSGEDRVFFVARKPDDAVMLTAQD